MPNLKHKIAPFMRALGLSIALLLISACDDAPQVNGEVLSKFDGEKVASSSGNFDLSIWPELPIKPKEASVETKIQEIIAGMTLEQKVAQLIQPEIRDVTVEDMRRYGFGSYLNGGGAFPNNNKHATPQDWVALAEAMYQASVDDTLDGSSIPTIWGTDAVHGHNNVIGATLFPHNIGLGATNNPALIEEIAGATAREVMATGIDWVFAPTVAVVRDDRWGRTYEGYSEDPEIVRAYSAAIVKGLQGGYGESNFLDDDHVISTVKHFLGDGGTQDGVDQGNNIASEQDLFDLHAQGYVGGLSAGSQTVMASFNSWHGKKMHGHKYLLTDVLKDKMGFDGFVVGDWLGHGQIKGCSNQGCSQAINAGLDVFMAPSDAWKPLLFNTIAQVKSGEISESRINDAVSRVLRVKIRAGVFDKPSPANRALSGKLEIIGAPEHRAIARRAVRESLVLLKNNAQLLPLNPNQRVLVAGDAADNIGKQSGGWTITWQGTGNKNNDFPGGTSIFQGIEHWVSEAGGVAELSVNGDYQQKPDVAIVVFGEEPYAEGNGDIATLEYQAGNKRDLALLKKLQARGIPVVSVFISGRPLWVNPELNASDAFVAAWLPGSEGIGVADVLFRAPDGTVRYDFTGRLSFSWPARPDQTVLNRGDENYAPLLPYGFGLRYGEPSTFADNLSELRVPMPHQKAVTERVLFRKSVQLPLTGMAGRVTELQEMSSNVLEVAGLKIRTLDRELQEDARLLEFTGGDAVYALTADQPMDLTNTFGDSAVLRMQIRIGEISDSDVTLSMLCGVNCNGSVNLAPQLRALPRHEWQSIQVALSCFSEAGANLTKIDVPFQLRSRGKLELSFSEIVITNSESAISCN
ncbi:glucan 1,4-beta-glucosidase [Arenicella chitinivorans]|uniref:Glucan 1,4-beta-glucosidase n=1 Tax=Arenicella chitinivorans TaxID=1329800 RepID=A0A918VPE7_9GAMM|nr:exo 1,3/1,4-beta-D-glucan glucohydrolase [Arenicella chitinivorans]GHA13313.1 glucan 1,4-beta-glucosidase [Arenicella chitinivorans]